MAGLEQVRLEPTSQVSTVLDRDSDIFEGFQPGHDLPVPGGTFFDRELLDPASHFVHRDERVPVLVIVGSDNSHDSPFHRSVTSRAATPIAAGHASVVHSNQQAPLGPRSPTAP